MLFWWKDLYCCLTMWTSAGTGWYKWFRAREQHLCGYSIFCSCRGQAIAFIYHTRFEFLFNHKQNGSLLNLWVETVLVIKIQECLSDCSASPHSQNTELASACLADGLYLSYLMRQSFQPLSRNLIQPRMYNAAIAPQSLSKAPDFTV